MDNKEINLLSESRLLDGIHDSIDKEHRAILELGVLDKNLHLNPHFKEIDKHLTNALIELEKVCRIKRETLQQLNVFGNEKAM